MGGGQEEVESSGDRGDGLLERFGRKAVEFTGADELVEEARNEAEAIGRLA
jgi:hypothetical protein